MATPTTETKSYQSFAEFYPFYLSQHQVVTCRVLHFCGTLSVLILLLGLVVSGQWQWAWLLPLLGYGPAWVGHFFFENNRPATFKYPLYSLLGDLVMFWQLASGKISFK
ncbi:DUF962 domain-containing protein [Shewanella sp. NIFS-20-20]|uniref:DUF962 domain-containing protein n=1 Tax=Shewanella sp. NIFS-20-20 TaxID=2853806 RepID=UPI001C437A4F|nr:DUF962 domain-containing protein [Shewanella sp. NIFS-20-20]MBV7317326.1 DUF962 domain-containing protein [Shewanella sp. NIFS-20-20]